MKTPVYLNYAATSNHKPQQTIEALCQYLEANNTSNSGRSFQNLAEMQIAFETRSKVAAFFNASSPAQVIFTPNVTTALNMVLNGIVRQGDHVLTTSVEHNAVARPLHLLEQEQIISTTYLPCDGEGNLLPSQVEAAIKPESKVLIMTHASNVLGTILPIKECFKIAKKHGLLTILDSAQTAGVLPIDMAEMDIDILAFTGHKSLLAVAGIGGFVLRDGIGEQIRPWLTGGTGSQSQSLEQPLMLPDKFEAGTGNTVGILSLGTSIDYLNSIGLDKIRQHEEQVTAQFLTGLESLPVQVLGTKAAHLSVPVVSIVSPNIDSGELSQILFEDYQIITRCGLHCAPLAHQTAGTEATGAVRFSFGWETTAEEIQYTLQALAKILFDKRGVN